MFRTCTRFAEVKQLHGRKQVVLKLPKNDGHRQLYSSLLPGYRHSGYKSGLSWLSVSQKMIIGFEGISNDLNLNLRILCMNSIFYEFLKSLTGLKISIKITLKCSTCGKSVSFWNRLNCRTRYDQHDYIDIKTVKLIPLCLNTCGFSESVYVRVSREAL